MIATSMMLYDVLAADRQREMRERSAYCQWLHDAAEATAPSRSRTRLPGRVSALGMLTVLLAGSMLAQMVVGLTAPADSPRAALASIGLPEQDHTMVVIPPAFPGDGADADDDGVTVPDPLAA